MKIDETMFTRPAMELAEYLAGKLLVRKRDGRIEKLRITETEAYLGENDTASHAHKGRTARTEPIYQQGGTIYVYLCYGIHNLINIAAAEADCPECVLIRACEGYEGPGKLTKRLGIDRTFNGKHILRCEELWLEDDGVHFETIKKPRVGIQYAQPEDVSRLCRFIVQR